VTRLNNIALAVVVLALFTAGCGDTVTTTTEPPGAEASPTPTTTAAPATTADTAPPTTSQTTTLPATTTSTSTTIDDNAPDVTASATVTDGEVATDTPRVEAELGSVVEVTVISDVADELHIHGYDLFADLEPGVAATVRFEADIPGIFEIELEDARLEVFSLEVS
jgi:hypothetical protein